MILLLQMIQMTDLCLIVDLTSHLDTNTSLIQWFPQFKTSVRPEKFRFQLKVVLKIAAIDRGIFILKMYER